jgi:hypothetical protein
MHTNFKQKSFQGEEMSNMKTNRLMKKCSMELIIREKSQCHIISQDIQYRKKKKKKKNTTSVGKDVKKMELYGWWECEVV